MSHAIPSGADGAVPGPVHPSGGLGLLTRAIDGLSKTAGVLATLLLIAATLVVCQMVFSRYVFRASTVWQTEFVTYASAAAIFLGSPYVLILKGHVGVDVVHMLAGARTRRLLDYVAAALSLAFCLVIAWTAWHYFYEAWDNGWRTETVWALPLWIPLLPMVVGFVLLCLQYVAEILKLREAAR
jgi:TRAP-type C4-dicarboxylate transport system permease small subunit